MYSPHSFPVWTDTFYLVVFISSVKLASYIDAGDIISVLTEIALFFSDSRIEN